MRDIEFRGKRISNTAWVRFAWPWARPAAIYARMRMEEKAK
jgi:hypothetical protein